MWTLLCALCANLSWWRRVDKSLSTAPVPQNTQYRHSVIYNDYLFWFSTGYVIIIVFRLSAICKYGGLWPRICSYKTVRMLWNLTKTNFSGRWLRKLIFISPHFQKTVYRLTPLRMYNVDESTKKLENLEFLN